MAGLINVILPAASNLKIISETDSMIVLYSFSRCPRSYSAFLDFNSKVLTLIAFKMLRDKFS